MGSHRRRTDTQLAHSWSELLGPPQCGRTKGAKGNGLLAIQYYGCCVVDSYNQGRPHSSLGPGIPDPGEAFATTRNRRRHQLAHDCKVVGRSVLGGLHHEYRLERIAAWTHELGLLICIRFTCSTGWSPTATVALSHRRQYIEHRQSEPIELLWVLSGDFQRESMQVVDCRALNSCIVSPNGAQTGAAPESQSFRCWRR